jgi:branched-chain amino acid transport system permease protein
MDAVAVGCLYALIALGYTLVYGVLKFINFAHSDIFALGAWLSLVVAGWFGAHVQHEPGAPLGFWVGGCVLLAAMAGAGLAGFLIERFAYRPLRNSPRLNVLITAIGISLLLQNTGALPAVFGNRPRAMTPLISDTASLGSFKGVELRDVDAIIIVTAVLLMVGLNLLVFHTKVGMAMRAVAHNTKTAALMGINVDRIVSFTFVLGSSLAAAAGFLYALKYPVLKQTADNVWVLLGLKAFVAAVVGGIGNVKGAMLGGLCIAMIEFFGVAYVSDKYRDVYVFGILIAMLLVRPGGIMGKSVTEKV